MMICSVPIIIFSVLALFSNPQVTHVPCYVEKCDVTNSTCSVDLGEFHFTKDKRQLTYECYVPYVTYGMEYSVNGDPDTRYKIKKSASGVCSRDLATKTCHMLITKATQAQCYFYPDEIITAPGNIVEILTLVSVNKPNPVWWRTLLHRVNIFTLALSVLMFISGVCIKIRDRCRR